MPKPAVLEIEKLVVHYGVIAALRGISLKVHRGDIVTLIGANGAGKTTVLRTVSALLRARSGVIRYEGSVINNLPPHRLPQMGVAHVPEGRMIFAPLTVLENLKMGAYLVRERHQIQEGLDYVYGLFPRLKERSSQMAGTLSGGEQQMLAIGRALMGRPKFLMLDEPSLGIAPILVQKIFEKIVEINRDHGMTILLVEQNANLALEVATYGYVLETGQILLEDTSGKLRENPKVKSAYLGG